MTGTSLPGTVKRSGQLTFRERVEREQKTGGGGKPLPFLNPVFGRRDIGMAWSPEQRGVGMA